jgi:prepilin-type N-terminal cleavage/methylation domain-containing protein
MSRLSAAIHASRRRVRREEGFTLIELMIALGVILVALIAMAYTVTSSLSNVAYARQRDAANSLADQTIEQMRALPFATIQSGLDNTDLATTTDPNIEQPGTNGCPAGWYCYKVTPSASQCPSGVPSYGERIPHGTNPAIAPLVPHQQTQTVGPTTYTVSVYVSYLCNKTTTNAFRVTAVVSWPNAEAHGAAPFVSTQSVFYSQSGGCIGSGTHPYAAPCQPYFYGTADVQNASIGIDGSIQGITLDPTVNPPASLDLPEFTSNMAVEQITSVTGVSTTSGATIDLSGSSPSEAGYARNTTDADSDPAQPGNTYSETSPYPATGPGATQVVASGTGNSLTLTPSGGDLFGSTSTTAASLSNACADSTGVNQTDSQPCGNAVGTQSGLMSAVLDLKPPGGDLGNTTLASLDASSGSFGFTKRDVTAQPGTCAGTSGDGCIHADAERTIGTLLVGTLPPAVASSAPPGWNGYLLQVTNFHDSAVAESGVGGGNPSVTSSGTISYWTGSGYATCTISSTCTQFVTTPTVDVSTNVTGVGTIEVVMGQTTWRVNTLTTTKNVPPAAPDVLPSCVAATTCTANESATSTSPVVGVMPYRVDFFQAGVLQANLANLTVNVDLGKLQAVTRYKPAN